MTSPPVPDSVPPSAPAGANVPRVRRGDSRRPLAIALATVAMLVLLVGGFAAWNARGGRQGDGLVFVIPAGASATVETPGIDSAVAIPTDIRFGRNETAAITIVNQDAVSHRAGPFLVAPGQTYRQRFPDPGEYFIACSVDPAESVTVMVEG